MSNSLKDLLLAEVEEESDFDVLSTRFSNELGVSDMENLSEVRSREQDLSDDNKTGGIVAQCDANSQTSEEIPLHCDSDGIETSKITSEKYGRELLIEQYYWDQHGPALAKINNPKYKHPTSQRISTKLYNVIAARKMMHRDLSYFNLDRATTTILENLIKEDYVGRFYNVIGRGSNSVIIHADGAYTSKHIRIRSCYGNAVKIHKLSKDVEKNAAILKRTQREYDHLLLLNKCSGSPPYVLYKKRNIIIMLSDGSDEDAATSISDLPADHSEQMYHVIISNLTQWYNKAHVVHGRLSPKYVFYRIFTDYLDVKRCNLTVFGWSHSVKTDHPQASKKLMRDCLFVTNFFRHRNVQVKPVDELFKEITGMDNVSNKVLEVLNVKDWWEAAGQDNPNTRRMHRDKDTPMGNCRFK